MDLREKIKRALKLGFFVTAGTAAALLSACKGDTTEQADLGPPDLGEVDQRAADSQPPDRGQDLLSPDKGAADTGKPPIKDTRGWDIPLE